jgi:outer membrane receptor protein involved in Fe transport
VLAGADVQRVEAVNTDRFITPPATRVGGGTLLQHGWFGQIDGKLSHARFFLGARQHFAGNQGRFFSPTTGFAAGRGWFRARGSVYRGFRTPTLNELYREFRVGTAVTQANPDLKAEKLFGAEAGVDILGEQWRIHVTFFRNELAGLITNVTLSTTPALTLRQRRNAADALSRGFETEIRHRWKWLETDAAYLFVDSRYTTGERVPQVPRHQGSAQVTWTRGGAMLSAGFRSFSAQFEDDRNQFLLAGYATVHFAARRHITRGLSAVLQAENLLDREYPTGLSAATVPRPLFTIGAPRLWRAGLRWEGRLR